MSNLQVFWNIDQQFPCQVQSDNLDKEPLNLSDPCSDLNILSSDKSNNDLSFIDCQQFLNLGEDQYQQSIQDQLCFDNCQFLNQEQVNLIQNVNREEQIAYMQENYPANLAVMNQELNLKLLQKQKRQQQREKAKNRKRNAELVNIQVKEEEESTEKSQTTQIKIEEESILNPKEQSKEQKKQMQQIRNRISAQMSRDKKKAYVTTLEENQKKLEERLKVLEEQNAKLKNLSFINSTPTTTPKKNFALPKKEVFKYGFAFFSVMALVCSLQMQNNGKSIKQVDSIEQQPVANNNNTLNSINYLSGFNSDNNLQEQNFNESLEQAQLKILPQIKIEEDVGKEEIREEKIEKVTKKINKQKKPGQRKVRAIDSK